MNNTFEKFVGDSKKMKLHSSEKNDVRNQLKMHIAKDTVTLSEAEKLESRHFLQMFIRRLPKRHRFIHFSLQSMTAAFAVLALCTGGFAYAAEDTVPGDTLYSLKVDITEPLRGHFKFSSKSKAQWHARRIERRLEEGQRLMGRGEKFEEHLPMLQKRLEMHTQKLEQRLTILESDENAEKIRAHIENTLLRQEAMLDAIESGEIKPEQMRAFKKKIHEGRMRMHDLKKPEKKMLRQKKAGSSHPSRMMQKS